MTEPMEVAGPSRRQRANAPTSPVESVAQPVAAPAPQRPRPARRGILAVIDHPLVLAFVATLGVLGGLLIGLIEAFWSAYFSIEYKDVATFTILVLVLIFRPTGLLGKPEIEKV